MDPAEVRRRNCGRRRLPLHDAHRHRVRLRRLRPGARPRARGRRLRRRSGPSRSAADRPATCASSASGCRSTSRSPVRAARSTPRSSCAGRHGPGEHRHVAPRPGPRHGLGHARERPARHPDRRIEVVHGDTDLVPPAASPAAPARCSSPATNVWRAAGALVEQAPRAGRPPAGGRRADVVLDADGGPVPRGRHAGRSLGWDELAAAADEHLGEPLRGLGDFAQAGGTFPFGAHSPSSRSTPRPARSRSCGCGGRRRRAHPQPAAGRGPGARRPGPGRGPGAARGGRASTTTATRSPRPSPTTPSSPPPSCPSSSRSTWRRPRRSTSSAPRASASPGTIGSTPAVQNAVVDALSHLGVRHIDMPATPERVWRAILAAG